MKNTALWRRNVVSVVLFILISVVMLTLQILSQESRAALAPRSLELVGTKSDGADNERAINLAKQRLAMAPNDSHSLNLLYVDAMNSDPEGSQSSRIGKLLSQQGWRYSPVQQNLLMTAVVERDFEAIVKNSDALLRRNQATDEILTLLRLFEIEAGTRKNLVKQLALDPPWKAAFLRQTARLKTSAQAKARGQTLAAMLADGQEISRIDLAPSLDAMVSVGEFTAAWKLYNGYMPLKNDSIINDPAFLQLAKSREAKGYLPFPFEWKDHSTRGLQVSATESIDKAEIQIRWNGRGVPLMLSQYVKIPTGGLFEIQLDGVNVQTNLTRIMEFLFVCGQETIRFENMKQDLKSGKITLSNSVLVPCTFPRFEIAGRAQEVVRPQDIHFSSVQIYPKN